MDDIAKTGVAAQELTQFVERVERLEEEKKAISDDIREVYAEMKGRGFDVRAVRQIIRIRKQDHSERKRWKPFSNSIWKWKPFSNSIWVP